MQSPINITKDNCMEFNPDPLNFIQYWNTEKPVTVLNDGECVKLLLEDNTHRHRISGGNLEGCSELRCIEFHWGPCDDMGTEHTFNGKRFSMEVHLIHHNSGVVLAKPEGLVIIAFLLQVACVCCNAENTALMPLINLLPLVSEAGSTTEMKSKDFNKLLELLETKASAQGYFTYEGSRTSPDYEEVVTWIIYPSLIIISHNQAEAFRKLKSKQGTSITRNFRDIQPLNGRIILYC